mmetsp:Transcript_26925/g.34935  ORF Transcript_26925/g.34935 Transcript_26925/m.34935 type:complete len:90 (+) Transcript_26925:1-270(+)|eukprot:CAMPEP_0114341506 /NCGR_PEP_ID=MMETSP0101-20121206/9092_1 /TAXON_ID=38822 ORGANISM="Pteridomonas danica, Strain PT" /NCGR_SAMPLE_ID=MMETSP0101 /ASSEMBLY_ACC=CAM_ASM_000211 /LENGTH=89 /DNA_ID=CAMNT_0001475131 /DNA_START=16 /DNA_END=285 /DNA_ORIENTATION=+
MTGNVIEETDIEIYDIRYDGFHLSYKAKSNTQRPITEEECNIVFFKYYLPHIRLIATANQLPDIHAGSEYRRNNPLPEWSDSDDDDDDD